MEAFQIPIPVAANKIKSTTDCLSFVSYLNIYLKVILLSRPSIQFIDGIFYSYIRYNYVTQLFGQREHSKHASSLTPTMVNCENRLAYILIKEAGRSTIPRLYLEVKKPMSSLHQANPTGQKPHSSDLVRPGLKQSKVDLKSYCWKEL